jgi:hypothetical protein
MTYGRYGYLLPTLTSHEREERDTSTMTRHTTPTALITLLAIAIIGITAGYSTPPSKSLSPSKCQQQSTQQFTSSQSNRIIVSRHSFLTTSASSTLSCLTFLGGTLPQPAVAKEVDPSIKGTKSDPEFQNCLSQCVYECTKPKGAEQKSRGECLPECKTKCAKTKAQASGKIMDRM